MFDNNLKVRDPGNHAARTKSSSRSDKNLLRTVLARPGQLMRDMMMVIKMYTRVTVIPGGIAADRAIQRGSVGKDEIISMIR